MLAQITRDARADARQIARDARRMLADARGCSQNRLTKVAPNADRELALQKPCGVFSWSSKLEVAVPGGPRDAPPFSRGWAFRLPPS